VSSNAFSPARCLRCQAVDTFQSSKPGLSCGPRRLARHAAGLPGSATPSAAAISRDLSALQGKWLQVHYERDGVVEPLSAKGNVTV
jgi:hypothetical protein